MTAAPKISDVLGVEQAASELDLLRELRNGLPYEALERIRRALDLTLDELADALAISVRTLNRRKKAESLEPDESDRVYRIARVYAHALEVFGDRDKASKWFKRENSALGGEVPLEVFDTDLGAQMVDDVLTRIEFGVYS